MMAYNQTNQPPRKDEAKPTSQTRETWRPGSTSRFPKIYIRKRLGWLFMIAIAGVITILLAQQWLFVQAFCQRLIAALLYPATVITAMLMAIVAILNKNNRMIDQLVTAGFVVAVGILVPLFGGAILEKDPEVRSIFCPSCDEALNRADKAYADKQMNTAAYLAKQCFDESLDGSLVQGRAGSLLADIKFVQADEAINVNQCSQALPLLDESEKFAVPFKPTQLLAIQQARKRCPNVAIAPLPTTPRPFPTLPISTPTLTPTPSRTVTVGPPPQPTTLLCDRSAVQISQLRLTRSTGNPQVTVVVPRQDIEIPRNSNVEIYGVANLPDAASYEIRYHLIDSQGALIFEDWKTIGSKVPNSVGNLSSFGFLVNWEQPFVNSTGPGRYALFLRMFYPDGRFTREEDFEKCWAFIRMR